MRIAFLLVSLLVYAALIPASADNSYPASEKSSTVAAKVKIAAPLLALMNKYEIVGGQFCVARHGQIIYSGAFGFADCDKSKAVTYDNLFRIASLSKVVTSTAIWQLIEQGKLSLDDKAFSILSDLHPQSGAVIDPRLKSITVLQLLQHSSGFGNPKGDPQFIYERSAADAFKEPRPASPTAIIRMAMGDPLEYDPGSKSVYSNLNFNILGRIIEHVSGEKYDAYTKQNVLRPAGIADMELGHTRAQDKLSKEVYYWPGQDRRDQFDSWSVLDEEPFFVSAPYGRDFAIECFDAHGGWLASAEDLVRLTGAIDGHPIGADSKPLIKEETLGKMLTASTFPVDNDGGFRAQGVVVKPKMHQWSHTGGMAGTSAFLYSVDRDLTIAGVFNRLPTPEPFAFFQQMDELINKIATELK